jgi:Tat protein translocase TatB subunit
MPAAGLAFLGGAIGGPEVLVIAVAVLILFGPKRLPEIARSIGRTIAQLRQSAQEFKDQVTREADESVSQSNASPSAGSSPLPAARTPAPPAVSGGRRGGGEGEPSPAEEPSPGRSGDGLAG